MDLDRLEVFRVACQEGSLSRAAVRLFRSQPSVTRQILALEHELGVILLERTSRGVKPTPAGEEVLRRALRVFRELDALKETAKDAALRGGDLRIACSDSVARYFLGPVLGRFVRENPQVRIHLSDGASPEIAILVAQGDVDVGFVLLPLRHPSLSTRVVMKYRHVAAFPADSGPLERTADPLKLVQLPLVLLDRRTRTRQLIEEGFQALGTAPQRVVEVGNVSVQKTLVREGLGIGILPDYTCRDDDGLVYRPIAGSSARELAVCTHKTDFPGGPASAFLDLLFSILDP